VTAERTLRADALRNQERILGAAREVFAEHGVEAGIDEVARRAGVGVGTIYRRFPTKSDLVDALVAERLERLELAARAGLTADDPWAALVAVIEDGVRAQIEDQSVFDVLEERARRGPRAQAAIERLLALFEQLIVRAQRQGTMRNDVVLEDVVFLVHGAAQANPPSLRNRIPRDQWRRALHVVLDGLRAERATPLPGAKSRRTNPVSIRR
jgi:AcrR family transcriptional regulator